MDILYIIPARAGSKGIPGKNTKLLGNKPLVSYTIECALQIADPASICISTNDDEVMKIAEEFGLMIPFIRPSELCNDSAGQFDVIKHAFDFYKNKGRRFEAIVLLQPTSPFRKPVHISEAINIFNSKLDMVVSVMNTSANPYFVLFEENEEGYLVRSKDGSFNRRQDCPEVWQLNGAIYVINSESIEKYKSFHDFQKIRKFLMPKIHSIDIDDEIDFKFAEFLLSNALLPH